MTQSVYRRGPRETDEGDGRSPIFGDLLRRHRLAAGLTQEALAERSGLSPRSIQDLERGRHRPHRHTAECLIRGLSLSGDDQSAFEEASDPAPRRSASDSKIRLVANDNTRTAARPSHNLPQPPTSFVGREDDLAAIRSLLMTARLVTLTGAGGCGKTRLAIRAAWEVAVAFQDNVTLVELAPVVESHLVAQTISQALGIREQGGQSIAQTMVEFLDKRPHLLILDNCEHLIDASAQIVAFLLTSCPHVTVLATSRQALRTSGEVIWRVPSLPVPAMEHRFPPNTNVDALIADFASIRLFLDRARAVCPGFQIANGNVAAIVEICSRVDGMPLAIELAAALVGDLSTELIAERLSDSFELLSRGDRAALPRQQTLQAAIDWSHGLLSEPERALFRRLAIFSGGFSVEGAEAVAEGQPLTNREVLPLLARLVDKSLVQAYEYEGGIRYRLLETLRQYAWDQLARSNETDATHVRHCDWCLSLVERAEPELFGARQSAWVRTLRAEYANIRSALEWSRDRDPEQGLRLAASLWPFWEFQSRTEEPHQWIEDILARASGDVHSRAKALFGSACPAFCGSSPDNLRRAKANLEESLASFRELGDLSGSGWALQRLAILACTEENKREAVTRFEESIDCFRLAGDSAGVGLSLRDLGLAYYEARDLERGRELLEESNAVLREVGDCWNRGWTNRHLSDLYRFLGEPNRSRAFAEEARALFSEIGDDAGVAICDDDIANVDRLNGNSLQADRRLRSALAAEAKHGLTGHGGLLLLSLGFLALGDGNPIRALLLISAARATPVGSSLWPAARAELEQSLSVIEATLPAGTYDRVWNEGQAMGFDKAVEYAMSDVGEGRHTS